MRGGMKGPVFQSGGSERRWQRKNEQPVNKLTAGKKRKAEDRKEKGRGRKRSAASGKFGPRQEILNCLEKNAGGLN